MPDILIQVIGDREHGFGHVVRCVTLAEQLQALGLTVEFHTLPKTAGATWLTERGYRVHTGALPTAAVGVIDLENGPEREQLLALRQACGAVVVVAGSGYTLRAPGLVRELSHLRVYQSLLPTDDPAGLSGAKYIAIRPEYRTVRPDYDRGHILVTMAGADPHGLTAQAVELLDGLPLKVVLGPAMAKGTLPKRPGVEYVQAPDGLKALMDGAQLVVCPLGMTAYEAACAGLSTLLTAWSADHERTAQEFALHGCSAGLGLWTEFRASGLRATVDAWRSDPRKLQSMGARGRRLVDGLGAARVAERLFALVAEVSQ